MSSTNTLNTLISYNSDNKFKQKYKAFKQQRIKEEAQMEKALVEYNDQLCHEASSDPSTLVVVTDASVIPPRNMQAVSAAHFWRLGVQVLSSKAPARRATALDAELFAIRLGVAKATSFDIKHIILITDSLSAARRAVDALVHSGQAHSLFIVRALRKFFTQHPDISINFWDCLSKAQWSLHHLVHEDVTNTRIAAGRHPATLLDALCFKSTTSCLDVWRSSFSHPSSQGRHFLPLKGGNRKPLQPSYAKGGSWLPLLLSRSHCVPGRLKPSSTMLPLGSSDSAFSLQSVLSVHVAIAR